MNLIGKTIKFLFPNFVARILELDSIKNRIVWNTVKLRRFGDGNTWDCSREAALKTSKELQSLRREFNEKKMWFMKKV